MSRVSITVVVLAALVTPSATRGYPIPRPGHERDILWEDPIVARGPWVTDDPATLSLSNTERARNVFVVPSPGGPFLRLRLRDAAGVWVALLFRVEVHTPRPLRMRAYGLVLNTRRRRVEFLRFDEGGVREPPRTRRKLPAHRAETFRGTRHR